MVPYEYKMLRQANRFCLFLEMDFLDTSFQNYLKTKIKNLFPIRDNIKHITLLYCCLLPVSYDSNTGGTVISRLCTMNRKYVMQYKQNRS